MATGDITLQNNYAFVESAIPNRFDQYLNPIANIIENDISDATSLAIGQRYAATCATDYTCVLPAADISEGYYIQLRSEEASTANISITTVESNTIDGESSLTLSPLDSVLLQSDGINWVIIWHKTTGATPSGGGDYISPLVESEIPITTTDTLTIGRQHLCTATSADYTVTLPAASGNAGKFLSLRISENSTYLIRLDGNGTEEIDGKESRLMWANETALLYCDGTGWIKMAGKSIPMECQMKRSSSTSIPNGAVTKITLNSTVLDNTGQMANLGTGEIEIVRGGSYNCNGVAVIYINSGVASRVRTECYANSSQIGASEGYGGTGCYVQIPAVAGVVLSAGDSMELRGYQNSGSSKTVYGDASGITTMLHIKEIITW